MTSKNKIKRCQIDKLDIDLPCLHKATHHFKVTSKHIGIREKVKVYICQMHYDQLSDSGKLTELMKDGSIPSDWESSGKYSATLSG